MLRNTEFENKIKEQLKLLENKIILNNSSCLKFLQNNLLIKNYCENILKEFPEWRSLYNVIYYHIYLNKELKHCKKCNKLITFQSNRNRIYCSKTCCNTDSKFIQKRITTILSKPIEERQKSNAKRKETTIKKYGGIGFQVKALQEKTKLSWYKKYGCKNPMQNEKIKLKAFQTSIKKYGFKNKSIAVFYNKMITNWKNYIIPLFSKDDYKGKNNIYKWKCVLCGNEFEQKIFTTHHLENEVDRYIPRCLHCFPSMKGKSQLENELFQFCKEYFPNLKEHENKNVRTFIKNREIDILIPDIKLAIEFNGIKFHSIQGFTENRKENEYYNYHLNKTLECEKLGYRLIHIWENDWYENKELIKQKLIKVFLNQEDLSFTDNIIKLDRMWYSKNQTIKNYELIEETLPEMFKIDKYDLENCGYLIYKRKN